MNNVSMKEMYRKQVNFSNQNTDIFDWFNWLDEYRANVKHYLHLKNEQTLFKKKKT